MIGSLAWHLEKSCELEPARRFAQRRHVCIKVAVSISLWLPGIEGRNFLCLVFFVIVTRVVSTVL